MSDGVESASDGLRRRLGLLDGVAIFVGIILGSGIFIAPSAVAAAVPSAGGAALLWLLGGGIAACGALCYAECGARVPRAGGFFVFYREAFGDAVAFVSGWTAILITYPASIAAIAHVLADYLAQLVPLGATGETVAAASGVAVAGTLNSLGVRLGAGAQRVLTAIKVLAILSLCAAACVAAPAAAAPPAGGAPADVSPAVFLFAIMVLFWTYDGWSDVTLVSGEIRDPGRNLARTVFVGMAVLGLVYVAVQLSVDHLLGGAAASSDRVFADAVAVGLGERASVLVAGLIVVSTFGSINGVVLAASRIGYAMARAGVFPGWFGAVHPRFETPARSVIGLTAASVFYVFAGSFRELVSLFSFAVWIFYALTAVALLRLRRRGIGEPLVWQAPGGWLPPLVILTMAAYMTSRMALMSPERSLVALAVLLAGFPVYNGWRRLSRG